MKLKVSFLILSIGALLFLGCERIMNVEKEPATMERTVPLKIMVKDESGSMQKLFGHEGVPGAEIYMKSNMLGLEYHLVSDSNGIAEVDDIISDSYLITATRPLTETEMLTISGVATGNYRLTNTTKGVVILRADETEPVELPVNIVVGGSPLVISEIYGCGPRGSGLYFHDKYLELYNQTDSTLYLDGIMVAVVYASSYSGHNFVDDPEFIHSKNIWMIPGNGTDHPLEPGAFAVLAEDGIDHRINAPNSVDQSGVRFEFYKKDAPDIDNPNVPNMKRIYQEWGNDWLIGGEGDALVIAKMHPAELQLRDERFLIPYTKIIDGVEYLSDPTQLQKKTLSPLIDAGATGGIEFYTGKSMERIMISSDGRKVLKDDNNSSLDFAITNHPTPEYHYTNTAGR
ncbi:DUF4876 domain-containing protein [bacterium]|nr:DUF4876 domain-containing protein [bacterium]